MTADAHKAHRGLSGTRTQLLHSGSNFPLSTSLTPGQVRSVFPAWLHRSSGLSRSEEQTKNRI